VFPASNVQLTEALLIDGESENDGYEMQDTRHVVLSHLFFLTVGRIMVPMNRTLMDDTKSKD
jgi:hypothetical protein